MNYLTWASRWFENAVMQTTDLRILPELMCIGPWWLQQWWTWVGSHNIWRVIRRVIRRWFRVFEEAHSCPRIFAEDVLMYIGLWFGEEWPSAQKCGQKTNKAHLTITTNSHLVDLWKNWSTICLLPLGRFKGTFQKSRFHRRSMSRGADRLFIQFWFRGTRSGNSVVQNVLIRWRWSLELKCYCPFFFSCPLLLLWPSSWTKCILRLV